MNKLKYIVFCLESINVKKKKSLINNVCLLKGSNIDLDYVVLRLKKWKENETL